MTLVGKGFRLTPEEARKLSENLTAGDPIIRPYIIGRDITGRREERYVIDAFGKSEPDLRDRYPQLYQVLFNNVKPERDQNHRASYRLKWWIYAEPRQDLRRCSIGLKKFIATCRTAKHRIGADRNPVASGGPRRAMGGCSPLLRCDPHAASANE